jgi:hypothetical protein
VSSWPLVVCSGGALFIKKYIYQNKKKVVKVGTGGVWCLVLPDEEDIMVCLQGKYRMTSNSASLSPGLERW